jgi:hypothetical protein
MFDLKSYQQQMLALRAEVPYTVQFFFDEKPEIHGARLLELLRQRIGNVEAATLEEGVLGFAFLDHTTRFQEGAVPAQCMLSAPSAVDDAVGLLQPSVIQTWDWPHAEAAAEEARIVLSVGDIVAGALERKTRLDLYHKVIQSVLELLPSTLMMHWLPSQRIVEPSAYLEGMKHGGRLYTSARNVRMFRVEGAGEEVIMDTMGLLPFGIADLQCHFTGLQPTEIGMMLFNMGEFLFEKGEVFRDGDTVEGLRPADKWKCQHEISLIEPRRTVIDIHPGEFSPAR